MAPQGTHDLVTLVALLAQAFALWLLAGLTSTMSLLLFHPDEEEVQPWDERSPKGASPRPGSKGVAEMALSS